MTESALFADAAKAANERLASFRTIQALRAVAALLVVLYHAFEMWGQRVDATAPGVSWENGASGVDIFFIISGFVMVISSRRLAGEPLGWFTFLRHRIVRIVPLYWLLTTLKLIAVVVFSDLVMRTSLSAGYVVSSYLFLPVIDSAGHFRPVIPVGWTLTYEFLFYLIFSVALALRMNALWVVLPSLTLCALLGLARTQSWPDWTILFDPVVLEFGAGVALGQLTLRGVHLPPGIAAGLLVAGFGLLVILPMGSENVRIIRWGLPAFGIVAAAVALEPHLSGALPHWLLGLGNASYSIYLSHGFALPIIGVLIHWIGWSGLLMEGLTIVACLAVSGLVGMALYNYVERPMLRVFKR